MAEPDSFNNLMIRKLIVGLLILVTLLYLNIQSPKFPDMPPNSEQSTEPADVEDVLRKAYFTNLTRSEVLNYYQTNFKLNLLGLQLPNYRLNYPPEEAALLVRDQTRSTFLEEIVVPFRDSLYVNGFEPKEDKDRIIINGNEYRQKIVIKKIESNQFVRSLVFVLAICVSFPLFDLVYRELKRLIDKKK